MSDSVIVQLGFMSAFVKASADALKETPAVNGYIDDATKEIVHRNFVDISVAVASPTGERSDLQCLHHTAVHASCEFH